METAKSVKRLVSMTVVLTGMNVGNGGRSAGSPTIASPRASRNTTPTRAADIDPGWLT